MTFYLDFFLKGDLPSVPPGFIFPSSFMSFIIKYFFWQEEKDDRQSDSDPDMKRSSRTVSFDEDVKVINTDESPEAEKPPDLPEVPEEETKQPDEVFSDDIDNASETKPEVDDTSETKADENDIDNTSENKPEGDDTSEATPTTKEIDNSSEANPESSETKTTPTDGVDVSDGAKEESKKEDGKDNMNDSDIKGDDSLEVVSPEPPSDSESSDSSSSSDSSDSEDEKGIAIFTVK